MWDQEERIRSGLQTFRCTTRRKGVVFSLSLTWTLVYSPWHIFSLSYRILAGLEFTIAAKYNNLASLIGCYESFCFRNLSNHWPFWPISSASHITSQYFCRYLQDKKSLSVVCLLKSFYLQHFLIYLIIWNHSDQSICVPLCSIAWMFIYMSSVSSLEATKRLLIYVESVETKLIWSPFRWKIFMSIIFHKFWGNWAAKKNWSRKLRVIVSYSLKVIKVLCYCLKEMVPVAMPWQNWLLFRK